MHLQCFTPHSAAAVVLPASEAHAYIHICGPPEDSLQTWFLGAGPIWVKFVNFDCYSNEKIGPIK